MLLVKTRENLSEVLFRIKSNDKSIGFVPTMGALHQGHLSLIQRARRENLVVVVSIFINPIQFNNKEDLQKYPRTLDEDIAMIEQFTDILFIPSEEEMFSEFPTEQYHFGNLETVMEGASRPGHFNGVAIIVKRLFDLITPDKAYFGEKDFQQLAIIQALVKQYELNTIIVPCPVIRESNGLAMSSRNRQLSPQEQDVASKVYAILEQSRTVRFISVKQTIEFVISKIAEIEEITLDYFQIVDDKTLQEVTQWEGVRGVVGCVAFYINNVRLIDNVRYR